MTDAKRGRLEDLLADFREEATVLKRNGVTQQAVTLDRFCDAVALCMDAYLDWMSEDEARLWSAWSIDKLRAHFANWEAQGLAEWEGEGRKARRRYRRQVVPRRADTVGAFEAGKRSA